MGSCVLPVGNPLGFHLVTLGSTFPSSFPVFMSIYSKYGSRLLQWSSPPNPLGDGFHQPWELRARGGSGQVWSQAELWGCGGLCSVGKFKGTELLSGCMDGVEKSWRVLSHEKPSGEQAREVWRELGRRGVMVVCLEGVQALGWLETGSCVRKWRLGEVWRPASTLGCGTWCP